MNLNLFISKKNQIKISQFESIIIFRKKTFSKISTQYLKRIKSVLYIK